MSYDEEWPDMTWENRKAMVRKTLRPATRAELKSLGEERFRIVTDPWCIKFHAFLDSHPDSQYYRAEIPEKAEIIYCRDGNRGVWFLPGKGMGVLQPKGLEIMAAAVDAL